MFWYSRVQFLYLPKLSFLKNLPEKDQLISNCNSWRQLVFFARMLCYCNFLKNPCMTPGTTDWNVKVKSHPKQGCKHESLIDKLSHIGDTPILQFSFSFFSCLSKDDYWMPLASLQQLLGVYPDIFAWSGIVIFLYILSCRIKKERNQHINYENTTNA